MRLDGRAQHVDEGARRRDGIGPVEHALRQVGRVG
jgi:hypothetical protein